MGLLYSDDSTAPSGPAGSSSATTGTCQVPKSGEGDICANVKCIAGTQCVETDQGAECLPALSCDTAACEVGYTCQEDFTGKPVCVPTVCEGFTGFACPTDFSCITDSAAPDNWGKCVKDCAPTCGECVSDNQCGEGQRCTAAEECLTSCSCPMCNVCAGRCLAAE